MLFLINNEMQLNKQSDDGIKKKNKEILKNLLIIKAIKPLRSKELPRVKWLEKTYLRREDNKRTVFKETENDNWHSI